MRRIVRVDQLRKTQGASHASRPAADNDNIGGHLRPFNAFNRFAENEHKAVSSFEFRVSGFRFRVTADAALLVSIASIKPFSNIPASFRVSGF
jgi:hypothetical protein